MYLLFIILGIVQLNMPIIFSRLVNYFLFIIFIAFFSIYLFKIYNPKYLHLNIEFLNLDYSDVSIQKLYLNEYNTKKLTDVRIFKMNVSSFFPENSQSHSITILNHGYVQIKDNNVQNNKDYIYYAIDKKRANDYIRIRFFVKYTQKKNLNQFISAVCKKMRLCDDACFFSKGIIFDAYVKLECIDNELVFTKKRIYNYHRAFLYHRVLKSKIYDRKIDTKDYPLENLFYRSYMYNPELDIQEECKILKNDKITDRRKWLLHEGTFGCGKSTLDVLAISNTGCIPVIISPWEENYDIDILALIFKRVAEVSKKIFYVYDSSITIFILVALAGFFYFIQKIFLYFVDKLPIYILDSIYAGVFSYYSKFMNATICKMFLDMFLEIACIGIALLLALHILPKAIIYMKNSTKVHQDYYIKNIVKMLELENIIMIIEDMDRLNSEVAENVFRTLSAINRQCAKHHKIIGLLSFHITSGTKQGNNSSIEVSTDVADVVNSNKKILHTNTVLENLENKVIFKRIFGKYDDYTSKKAYIKNLVYILMILYMEQGENVHSLENLEIKHADLFFEIDKLSLKETNFRDIRKIIEDFAKEKKWEKSDFMILLKRLETNETFNA